MVPWMYLGWISVRKESRTLVSVFTLVSTVMLGGWGGELPLCVGVHHPGSPASGISTRALSTFVSLLPFSQTKVGIGFASIECRGAIPWRGFCTRDPEEPPGSVPSSGGCPDVFGISPDGHSPSKGSPTIVE